MLADKQGTKALRTAWWLGKFQAFIIASLSEAKDYCTMPRDALRNTNLHLSPFGQTVIRRSRNACLVVGFQARHALEVRKTL